MKKPLGVSASAVFALLGSLVMLLFFVLLVLALLFSPASAPLAPEARLGFRVGLTMFGLLGAWGTTTAIGLFRWRNWARISFLIFAGFLALMGFSGPVILLMPLPPTAPANYNAVRGVIAAVYGGFGVLGLFWLYYFCRRATREAFIGALAGESGGRPLSISIIGWWLLVTGVIGVLVSPFLRMPSNVLIWIVTGWRAVAWYLAFSATWIYVGYGLLRLNPVARRAAIGLLSFGAMNSLMFFVYPGRDERVADFMSRFHFLSQGPAPIHLPIIALVPGLVGLGVPLWFLITTKKAFERAALSSIPAAGTKPYG